MGNALIGIVTLQLKTGAPIEEIVELLGSIQADLQDQQDTADEERAEHQQTCETNINLYETTIEETKNEIANLEELISNSKAELESTKSQIETTETEIESLEEEYASAQEQRESEHAQWAEYDAEYTDSVDAVNEAMDLIAQLKTGDATLIQTKIIALQTRLNKAVSKGSRSLYAPMVASLAELASTADQNTVHKILNLLADLKTELEASQSEDADTEERQQAEFDEYEATITHTIADKKDRLASLKEKKQTLESTISQAESDLGSAEQKQATYEDLLAQQIEQCDLWEETYQRETEERNEEQDVLAQVVDVVQQRIVTTEDYLKERVNV
jgi:predicted RNase H-like nuclease (RuvC/YqgF family)